jgi:hypothetical protein
MPRRIVTPVQLALVVVLLGLVAVLLFFGRRHAPGEVGRSSPAAVLDPRMVQELVFQRGPSTIRVVREGDGFWIVAPYRDRADDQFIAQSLRVAGTLTPLRILPDTSAAPFGLRPPAAVWTCRWPGGMHQILLGDSLPAGGGRFARSSGSSAVLVVDPFLARRFLSPPAAAIHQQTAARLDVGPLDSVRIATREEHLLVVRRRADFWEFIEPLRVEGSAAQISRAVDALRNDGLTQFLGPTDRSDLRAMGLDPPRAIWTLVQGGRRQTVRIGHPTPDEKSVHVIPAGREVVALIGSENFRQWVDGISRLRENLVLRAPADSVRRVRVSDRLSSRLYTRTGRGGWIEIAPAETLAVRSDAFNLSLENLCLLRATGFRSRSARDILPGEVRVVLTREAGETDTLRIGRPQRGVSDLVGPRQPGVCEVPQDVYGVWSRWLERPLRP